MTDAMLSSALRFEERWCEERWGGGGWRATFMVVSEDDIVANVVDEDGVYNGGDPLEEVAFVSIVGLVARL